MTDAKMEWVFENAAQPGDNGPDWHSVMQCNSNAKWPVDRMHVPHPKGWKGSSVIYLLKLKNRIGYTEWNEDVWHYQHSTGKYCDVFVRRASSMKLDFCLTKVLQDDVAQICITDATDNGEITNVNVPMVSSMSKMVKLIVDKLITENKATSQTVVTFEKQIINPLVQVKTYFGVLTAKQMKQKKDEKLKVNAKMELKSSSAKNKMQAMKNVKVMKKIKNSKTTA